MRWSLPLLFIMTLASGQSLDVRVHSALAGFQGTVSIFAKNLDSGATFALRADERIRTASTIKLAILAAAFQAVEEGKLKWTDLSTLHEEDKVHGSGILGNEFTDGDRLPLSDLIHLMIVVSDNTATNMVLDRVPGDYVNDFMDRLGFKQTRTLKKIGANVKESGIFQAGHDPVLKAYGIGVSTSRELVTLVEKMERGEIVSPAASREMIAIMKRCQDRDGIARRLGGTVAATKYGALEKLRSDVGIVYSKRGRIAMAITCDDLPKSNWSADNPALLLIARLAQILAAGL
jgi:beta-lactamase class A